MKTGQGAGAECATRGETRLVSYCWFSAMLLTVLFSSGIATHAKAQDSGTQAAAQLAQTQCFSPTVQNPVLQEEACVQAAAALAKADTSNLQLRVQVDILIGDLRIMRKDFAGAKAAFERAKEMTAGYNPAHGTTLMRIAQACLGLQQADCGLVAFQQAAAAGFIDREIDTYIVSDLMVLKHGKSTAFRVLDRLTAQATSDSHKSIFNHAAAEVLVSLDRMSEATNYYIRAAGTTERASVWNALCWHSLVNISSSPSVDYYCDGALARDDKNAGIWDSSGLRYLLRDAAWQAFKAYDQAVKLDPDHAHALYGRGLANAKMGKDAEAQADKRRALAINPALEKTYASYFD